MLTEPLGQAAASPANVLPVSLWQLYLSCPGNPTHKLAPLPSLQGNTLASVVAPATLRQALPEIPRAAQA